MPRADDDDDDEKDGDFDVWSADDGRPHPSSRSAQVPNRLRCASSHYVLYLSQASQLFHACPSHFSPFSRLFLVIVKATERVTNIE